ncbi:hypothetical protein X759_20250 [Mesorhizobium sp. LSHC420B00]|nr:hypothetical protein X759_20250 [Mesorhizobium sp. LSHC420B00]
MQKGGGFKPPLFTPAKPFYAGKADADFRLHRLKRDVNMAREGCYIPVKQEL